MGVSICSALMFPLVTKFATISEWADLLIILANQLRGTHDSVREQLHDNVLYWMYLHHVTLWIWVDVDDAAAAGDSAEATLHTPVLSASRAAVLARILVSSKVLCVWHDGCCYRRVDEAPKLPPELSSLCSSGLSSRRHSALEALVEGQPQLADVDMSSLKARVDAIFSETASD
eukprot:NODE_5698_length_647_cov_56.347826_g5311_i0.p1 GENE.NODE_5698_length_647_cov_56.347826_g5311_i0~~NODE_5698_length_647_cov_56.347826_g5311_i0.p1  ORF type:complete len:174 (+),score=22.08 NODE_5698_length_647_cov_56.347826_g5311_i0:25-546(+)